MLFRSCLNSYILLAQPQVELSGQVKDTQTKKALEFCSISVFDTNDSLITGSVTNNKGFFMILLQKGSYRFIFNYLGYITDTSDVTTVTENKFLGVFKLEPDEKLLNEVTVKTSTRENLLDRDVRIITDKLRTGASDTKDVLDKLDGVSYDRFNNSIKVDNDANIIILVDGLEKNQEYIKNLSPGRLQKIEVIRDPSGRYALEGYSAVINIILRKDYQGTELYFNESLLIDPDADNSNYVLPKNDLSATLNYTYNKVNLYAKYSNNYTNFNILSSSIKEYDDGLIFEKNSTDDEELNFKIQGFSNNYTIGTDYYINPKHTISFESNLTVSPSGKNITEAIFDAVYIKNGKITDNFGIESKDKSDRKSVV